MMTARKILIILLLFTILFIGFQIKKMQDQKLQASISLNKKEFSSGDTLTLTIHNNEPLLIGRKIVFGQDYTIEYLQEGKWIEAKWLYPGIWQDIAHALMPGESFDQSIELFPVKKGTYRISKKVYAEGEDLLMNMEETVNLAETFKVIKGTPEEEIPKAELSQEFWEELEDYCTKELPEGVTKRDVRMHLNDMISKAVYEVDPQHKIFIYHGGGSYSVSIGVKHATREFIEKWPDVCHGAVIEVNVFSWALTEEIETHKEPMNLNHQRYDNLSNQPDYLATYGKLPEFKSEEGRQNWLAKLDEIGDRIRTKGKLSPYFFPNGSVIAYGHNYQGYFVVSFEKGSEVDESLMDEIYRIIDKEARELVIQEVPVAFRFESFPQLIDG